MPEATAVKPVNSELVKSESKPPTGSMQYTDDQLPALHKGVASDLKQAGIPASDLTLNPAPHLPDFTNNAVVDQKVVAASEMEPGSYKKIDLPGMPDIVRQHVTGDVTVIGNSGDMHGKKQEMNDAKISFLNQGQRKTSKNPFAWFYDEDKKAA